MAGLVCDLAEFPNFSNEMSMSAKRGGLAGLVRGCRDQVCQACQARWLARLTKLEDQGSGVRGQG